MNNELLPAAGGFSSQAIAQLSGGLQRQTSREIERTAARTMIAEAREQGRALLTNSALQNVAALSAFEAHLIEVAPLGEARYKHVVDAYTFGAAQAIQRW
jgi:hypothetical protein